MVLLRTLVPTHNVVVEDRLEVPALLLRHLGKVAAAVQPLLFARHRQKNNRRRKLHLARHLAQHPRAFQAHGGAAAIVIGAGRIATAIKRAAVSRIVMSGHQHNAAWIACPLENRVNIGDHGRLWNASASFFGEAVGFHFQAAATLFRITLELGLDPIPRRPIRGRPQSTPDPAPKSWLASQS